MNEPIRNYFTSYQYACMENHADYDSEGNYHFNLLYPEIRETWAAASSKDDFLHRILSRTDNRMEQYYGVLSMQCDEINHAARVHEVLIPISRSSHLVHAEGGSVMVRSPDGMFTTCISNNYGDGTFMVYEVSRGFNSSMMHDTGVTLKGAFNVMAQDYGDPAVAMFLMGTYRVYNYNGIVAFVRWE